MANDEPCVQLTHPLDVTVHQCSGCRLASIYKHNIQRHVQTCPGATLVSGTVKMVPVAMASGGVHLHGTRMSGGTMINRDQINNTNHIVINVIPAGSSQEKDELIKLFKDPETIKAITTCPHEDIPAVLLRLMKGPDAPPAMRNVRVDGDKVREVRPSGHEVTMSRTKFARKTMGDMIETCVKIDPTETAAQRDMEELRDELLEKEFNLGKKTKVSKYDVAKMVAAADPARYRLETGARDFIDKATTKVDLELDAL